MKVPQGVRNESSGSAIHMERSPIRKEGSPIRKECFIRGWEGSKRGPKVFPMGKDVPKGSPQYCQMFPTGHRVFPRGWNVCNRCSKGVLRAFNGVFNNIYGAL